MEFNFITECTSCNQRKPCNEEIIEIDGEQRLINFCKECYEEIEEMEKGDESL